jgi:hypothetical protein
MPTLNISEYLSEKSYPIDKDTNQFNDKEHIKKYDTFNNKSEYDK